MSSSRDSLSPPEPQHQPASHHTRITGQHEPVTGDPSAARNPERDLARHFESTFEHAAVGMAHVDLQGRLLRANRRFSQILGYNREDVLQLTFVHLTDNGTAAKDLAGLQELRNGSRKSYTSEKRFIRKDGSHVWGHVNVSLLRASDPGCDCFVVVLQDISERKQFEEDLARTNELLTLSQIAGGTGSFEWIIPQN